MTASAASPGASLRRIAYVLKVFPKLSETFIAEELAEVRRRGIDVRVFSLLPARTELRHSVVSTNGLDHLTTYPPDDFLAALKEFRPQLIHAHFATEPAAAGLKLATDLEIPFTFTAHGYDIHRKAPPDFAARAAVAAAVVTVSQANAEYIGHQFGVPLSHLRVIPCGIDLDRFRPASSSVAVEPVPLIVCVARHVAVKNLGLLLAACALLKQRGIQFHCVLVGDGPMRPELERLGAEQGLQNVVEFAGAAEQGVVLRWWQRATVGALTSVSEGMPVSLMEAAACGVPVVATAVGGVVELVEDGVTGLLVSSGDPAALADALARLLADKDLRTQMGLAACNRAQEMFSVTRQVDRLVALWSELVGCGTKPSPYVWDPYNAAADPDMPTLVAALDPAEATVQLKKRLPSLTGVEGKLRVKAICVTRYKPGRRCVVEYKVGIRRPGFTEEEAILIGKVRARRFGKSGYRLLDRIWKAGFEASSADGISVPEPLGLVPHFQMWFQRKVPGETATQLLVGAGGIKLSQRIAEAIDKLHRANVPTERRHAMPDELRILHECLGKVMESRPQLRARLEKILQASDVLGASLPAPKECGIHRDFYPAQVVVDGDRICLIDFDLYCMGDPALDVGNFLGHMTEQALRELGDARAMVDQESALEERFVELSGKQTRSAVRAYATLTLVRHIYLSTQFENRREFTEPLLALCEQRLL